MVDPVIPSYGQPMSKAIPSPPPETTDGPK